MHIKIYFDDKPLFLAREMDSIIEPFAHHDDAVLIDEFSTPGVNSMLHEMRQPQVHAGIFLHTDLDELKKAFWKKFNVLQAGGGLVMNLSGDILMMFRRGKWDLPKGKRDEGESIEDCAIREIKEETGLKEVILQSPLLTTYHTYDLNGKHILKETYWFKLLAPGHQILEPQAEEQITALEWVSPAQLSKYMNNSFPSIEDVLRKAGIDY